MTDSEREVHELMSKHKIYINRAELGKESLKANNKCNDNSQAFISYKKGSLFPRRPVEDPLVVIEERRQMM